MAEPAAERERESQLIASYDPATLERIGEVQASSDAEVSAAVERARAAQERWAAVPVRHRGRILLKARDYLLDNLDRLSELISRENGKPRVEALTSDLFPVAYLIDYFAKNAHRMLADEPVDIRIWKLLRRSSTINRVPRGVVAVISPWNFPFSIPAGEICMALMAGNAVLLKPARATCLIGEAIGEVYNAAGLPEGLCQVVHGSGSALTNQKLDFIAFTGSVATGKRIMAKAAETLTPVMLELGGKDPMIICADANLEVAASTAVWGAFMNSGQVCASVERVYVQESVAEAFLAKVVEKTQRLRQGHGVDWEVDLGAMTTEEQFEIVKRQVEHARDQGADILTGGSTNPDAGPGYFYRPTVMTGVGQDWECVQEETFGPTMPVLTFRDEAEAVAMANDSQFGLTASVWTRDLRRGEQLARRILAGTVYVNDAVFSHAIAETPWGGFKDTGLGRTHGKYGLLDFTELRHIHVNRMTGLKNPWMFQYSRPGYQAFKSTAMLLRSGMGAKARGAAAGAAAIRAALKRSL